MEKENNLYSPQKKGKNLVFWISIVLRILAVGASVASASLMFTNHQIAHVFGTAIAAKYSYVNSFKFMAYAYAVAGGVAFVTLCALLVVSRKKMTPNGYFLLFLLDLVVMSVVMAVSVAATAEGYLGRHGNSHAGWMAICGYFGEFCSRATLSLSLSYLALLFFIALTISSASSSHTWTDSFCSFF